MIECIGGYVPTKIHLYTDNLVVFNSQNLRIAPFDAVRLRHFIGYNDLTVMFYQPQKIELLPLSGSGPTSLKVSDTIEPYIERTGKSKILSKMLLKKLSVARCKSLVRSLCQTACAEFWHKILSPLFRYPCFDQFFYQGGRQRII